jgi:hypothetical protein
LREGGAACPGFARGFLGAGFAGAVVRGGAAGVAGAMGVAAKATGDVARAARSAKKQGGAALDIDPTDSHFAPEPSNLRAAVQSPLLNARQGLAEIAPKGCTSGLGA